MGNKTKAFLLSFIILALGWSSTVIFIDLKDISLAYILCLFISSGLVLAPSFKYWYNIFYKQDKKIINFQYRFEDVDGYKYVLFETNHIFSEEKNLTINIKTDLFLTDVTIKEEDAKKLKELLNESY